MFTMMLIFIAVNQLLCIFLCKIYITTLKCVKLFTSQVFYMYIPTHTYSVSYKGEQSVLGRWWGRLRGRLTVRAWVINAWVASCGHSVLGNEWHSHASRHTNLVWINFNCKKTKRVYKNWEKFWQKSCRKINCTKTRAHENQVLTA